MKYLLLLMITFSTSLSVFAGGSVGGSGGIVLERGMLGQAGNLDVLSITIDELLNIKSLQKESLDPVYLHTETRVLEVERLELKPEADVIGAIDIETAQSVLLIAD